MYRQAIVIFGMVIPGGVLLAALAIGWTLMGKFEKTRDDKVVALEQSRLTMVTERSLEKRLALHEGRMAYWNEHLEGDTVQSFNEKLDAILLGMGERVMMLEGKRLDGNGLFAKAVETPSERFSMIFEGGFGPMQEFLSELEVKMPQLSLESIEIDVGSPIGREKNLRFKVTYLAWQK